MPEETSPARRAGGKAPCVRFTPELGREICARLAAGESAHALAREPGMPSRRTFGDWAARDPAFGAQLEAAKLAGRRAKVAAARVADEARIWRSNQRAQWKLAKAGTPGPSRGSESLLTDALAEEICRRIAAGEPNGRICADAHMPSIGTLYGWVRRVDWFRERYETAKALAADLYFDLCLEVALETTEASVRSDRVRIAAFVRHAAQIAPNKYGVRRLLGEAGSAGFGPSGEPQPFAIEVVNFVIEGEGDRSSPA